MGFSPGVVYLGGSFNILGTHTRHNIAALDAASGAPTGWNPDANGSVYELLVDGGTVYVGGAFGSIGGQPRNNLAALNAANGMATAWNPNANGEVRVLAVSGGLVYAGGTFTAIGGQSRSYLAALSLATGNATSWNASSDGYINDLAIVGPTVYVGGKFINIGGVPRADLAAIDASTGLATAWNPNPTGAIGGPSVLALLVDGGIVYVGASNMTAIGGQHREGIAALDAVTGLATSWNPGPTGTVGAIVKDGSIVYVGGSGLGTIGGQFRVGVAALDATTGLATSWNADTYPIGTSNSVVDLWTGGGSVYIAGQFAGDSNVPSPNLAGVSALTVGVSPTPIASGDPVHLSPNPAHTFAQIDFSVPRAGHVEVTVFDVRGRIVGQPVNGELAAGRRTTSWALDRSKGQGAGIYFVKVNAAGQRSAAKLVVLE